VNHADDQRASSVLVIALPGVTAFLANNFFPPGV